MQRKKSESKSNEVNFFDSVKNLMDKKKKTLWEKENVLVPKIFFFSNHVFHIYIHVYV